MSIVGVAAPAFACSVTSQQFYSADLAISSFVGTKDANGHTLGTFTFTFCNNGSTTLPVGTSYTVTLTALRAPGTPSGDKNIIVGVGPQVGVTVSPATSVSLNPDGPTRSQSYLITTTTPTLPGTCRSAVFSIDTATGIGATKLAMAAQLRDFGTNPCSVAGPRNQSTISAEWGQNAT